MDEIITSMLPNEKVEMKDKKCCLIEMGMGEMNFRLGKSDALEEKYLKMKVEHAFEWMLE